MNRFMSALYAILFWGYLVIKIWGTAFLTWSWWWLLLPIVPWLHLLFIRKMNL